jgi:hypothetical protein
LALAGAPAHQLLERVFIDDRRYRPRAITAAEFLFWAAATTSRWVGRKIRVGGEKDTGHCGIHTTYVFTH